MTFDGAAPVNAEQSKQPGMKVDVGEIFDANRWSAYQKFVLSLTCLALILDGFDTLALGFAAPAMLPDLGISKAALAPVLAVGLIGMTIGAALGGMLGDRIGRKVALTGSVAIFGTMTALMATADDVFTLSIFRLLAGFGLGGALPNSAALVAEFTPFSRRSLAVTLSIVCIPVGGVVGGFVAAEALPVLGWRGLFAIAGALPLVIALLLLFVLPESPRFLVKRTGQSAALHRIFRRMGVIVPPDAEFVDKAEPSVSGNSAGALLRGPLLRDTLALWIAFFACLLSVYMSYNWLPTMLADAGFDLRTSSTGLLAFNVGAIIAAVAAAWLTGRLGSKIPMLILAVGGVIGALGLLFMPMIPGESNSWLILALAFEGACIAGVQVILYALAAHVYPTQIRATGVGAAAGIGRIGAVLSSFIGAAALSTGGSGGFYIVIAIAMAVLTTAIALVTRHVKVTVSAA
jgi:AAHS family 4-hydroxybenzoate transporter-like MFS transporter